MRLLRLLPSMLVLCLCLPAFAGSVAELAAAGRLRVETALEPGGVVVPGQRVLLIVMVATDRWFTAGTRVTLPDVPGLTLLEASEFAHNSSRQEAGQTWAVQRWSYEVYAQRAGDFVIPSPRVRVEISLEGGMTVAGELAAPAVELSVRTPAVLTRAGEWVATRHFSATETFDRPLEQLAVGDVLVRELLLSATGVPAMLLPTVQFESVAGLGIYPARPVLENLRRRGELTGRRRERVSYVAESPGVYRLPSLTFQWWDTAAGVFRIEHLPERQVSVAGAAALRYRYLSVLLPVGLLVAGLGGVLYRRPLWLRHIQHTIWLPLPRQLNPRSEDIRPSVPGRRVS